MNFASWLLIAAFAAAPQQGATPAAADPSTGQPPPPSSEAALEPDELPVSIDRIQRALAQPPAIRLDGQQRVFRVEIFGKKPTIEDILGPEFYKGPVKYGGMTHQEFLDMVTPEGVQGYAAFSNGEAATVAATSFVLKWALQQAIQKFRDAREAREKEAARREVLEALAELEKARAKAGLPPK